MLETEKDTRLNLVANVTLLSLGLLLLVLILFSYLDIVPIPQPFQVVGAIFVIAISVGLVLDLSKDD